MLAVILSEDENLFQIVAQPLEERGVSVLRYRDPVKLADNLPEIRPDFVAVRGADYPLHWMTLLAQIEFSSSLASSRLVLLGKSPPDESVLKRLSRFSCIKETGVSSLVEGLLQGAAKHPGQGLPSTKAKAKKGLMAAAERAASSGKSG